MELMRPRPGHFDSTFPETGPPPILTSAGIVVLYNGKNAEQEAIRRWARARMRRARRCLRPANPAHLLKQTEGRC